MSLKQNDYFYDSVREASTPCPLCEDPMRFVGIDYYRAKELYECRRCLVQKEVNCSELLQRKVI